MLKLKVEELNKELKKCQYSTKGNKKDLQQRLEAVIIKGDPLVEDMMQNRADNCVRESFSTGSHWDEINCDGEYFDKSGIENFHAPALTVGENPTTSRK